MKKVLIYYRYFGMTLGGGEYLPLTMIAELQKTCEVTLALDWTEHFDRAVSLIGIPVDTAKLKLVKVMPKGYRKTTNNLFESLVRSRNLKRLAKEADVCISLANLIDFGKPAHHVIISIDLGDPAFDDFVAQRHPSIPTRIIRFIKESVLRPLLGIRPKRAILSDPRETIYPNSLYTASLMESFYGKFNSRVFYPPTLFEANGENSARDTLSVLFLGRVAPFKRIEDMIAIVEKARVISGKGLKLKIAGKLDEGDYAKRLKSIASTRPWIEFLGPLYGEGKTRFLFSGSYALHVPRHEAFGISVTEYLKAGVVPVVVDGGGAKEIVADRELEFSSLDEAAEILARLVLDENFRESAKAKCRERAKAFTKESYLKHQREIIASMLASRQTTPQ